MEVSGDLDERCFVQINGQHLKNSGNMHEILLSGYFREELQ